MASPYGPIPPSTDAERMMIEIMGDANSYLHAIAMSTRATRVAAEEIAREGQQIERTMMGIGGAARFAQGMLAELGLTLGVVGGLGRSLQLAAEAESMALQFGVLVRNADQGRKIFQELVQFAQETPLTLPDVTRATRTLLQYGIASHDVMRVLREVGDVAGGQSDEFHRLSLAYGQVMQSGRLMGQEARQMINAGFNPLSEIARVTGRSMGSLREDMRRGKISTEMVAEAFTSATAEGGQFHNMMEKQSQTLGGQYARLTDEVLNTLRGIGEEIADALNLKEAMQQTGVALKEFTAWFKSLSPEIKTFTFSVLGAVVALSTLALAIYVGSAALGVLTAAFGAIAGSAVWPFLSVLFTTTVGAAALAMAAMGALAIYGIARVTNEIWHAIPAIKEMNAALEEMRKLGNRNVTMTSWRNQNTLGAIQEIQDPDMRRQAAEDELEMAERQMKDYEERVNAARRAERALRPSGIALWRPEDFGGFRLEEARNNLKELEGLLGSSSELVQGLRREIQLLEGTSAAQKLAEDVAKLNHELQKTFDLYGMTAEQRKIWELASRGATADELSIAQDLERRIRANRIRHDNEDPRERFARQKAELDDLLAAEDISPNTYARALAKITEELAKTADEASHANMEIRKFDAALVGSAESATRVEQYLDMLNDRGGRRGRRRPGDPLSPEAQALLDEAMAMVPQAVAGANSPNSMGNGPAGPNFGDPFRPPPRPWGYTGDGWWNQWNGTGTSDPGTMDWLQMQDWGGTGAGPQAANNLPIAPDLDLGMFANNLVPNLGDWGGNANNVDVAADWGMNANNVAPDWGGQADNMGPVPDWSQEQQAAGLGQTGNAATQLLAAAQVLQEAAAAITNAPIMVIEDTNIGRG